MFGALNVRVYKYTSKDGLISIIMLKSHNKSFQTKISHCFHFLASLSNYFDIRYVNYICFIDYNFRNNDSCWELLVTITSDILLELKLHFK